MPPNHLHESTLLRSDPSHTATPGRREPRAVKRRPKPYPRLMRHRRYFREISHQNRYYLNSRFGPKYRNSSRA